MIGLLGILIVFQTILAVAIVVVSAEGVSHQASQQWDRFLLQHRGRGLAVYALLQRRLSLPRAIICPSPNLMIGSVLVTLLTSVFLLKGITSRERGYPISEKGAEATPRAL